MPGSPRKWQPDRDRHFPKVAEPWGSLTGLGQFVE